MNKKTIILITAILSFSLGQSLKLPSIASTDLQSTGRIVVTNPDTGNEEIIFDATDQEKLKNNITANASEILDLKEWQEQQLEINQELSDKAFDLETEIDEINDSMGGYTEDGKPGFREAGADTVIPFKKELSSCKVLYKNAFNSSGTAGAGGTAKTITFNVTNTHLATYKYFAVIRTTPSATNVSYSSLNAPTITSGTGKVIFHESFSCGTFTFLETSLGWQGSFALIHLEKASTISVKSSGNITMFIVGIG